MRSPGSRRSRPGHALTAAPALVLAVLLGHSLPLAAQENDAPADTVRFATFNVSMNRPEPTQMLRELGERTDSPQAQAIAAIIQRVRPDVILLNELDWEGGDQTAQFLVKNYLGVPQAEGLEPIFYDYYFVRPPNTGFASNFDLDNDGEIVTQPLEPGYADDAFGFGAFPGQYGMALLSRYPIDVAEARTFSRFLWEDMPGNLLPDDPATDAPEDWYTPFETNIVRLSSKAHWDVPIDIDGTTVHLLASHPTPPTFDGEEDRNGRRNHDEIRFWSDYVKGGNDALYIYDDGGRWGGLEEGSHFVIAGDLNADPFDGDSIEGAIEQLLENPRVNVSSTPASEGAVEQAGLQGGANLEHEGDPAFDTADFADDAPGNLRVDYVLPSTTLEIVDAGVHWPLSSDPAFAEVGTYDPQAGGFPGSDHRLVWVDVAVPPPGA